MQIYDASCPPSGLSGQPCFAWALFFTGRQLARYSRSHMLAFHPVRFSAQFRGLPVSRKKAETKLPVIYPALSALLGPSRSRRPDRVTSCQMTGKNRSRWRCVDSNNTPDIWGMDLLRSRKRTRRRGRQADEFFSPYPYPRPVPPLHRHYLPGICNQGQHHPQPHPSVAARRSDSNTGGDRGLSVKTADSPIRSPGATVAPCRARTAVQILLLLMYYGCLGFNIFSGRQ